MRRTTCIVLAVFAASAVWSASASAYRTYSESHRYFQQRAADAGGVSINLTVDYAKRSPKGRNTPRRVFLAFQAPVTCGVGGGTTAKVSSPPFKLSKQKVVFSGSFSYRAPSQYPDPGSSGSYYATGRLIKKKNKRRWRMDGTITVLTYGFAPTFANCSSGEIPFSATQCWWWPPGQGPMCTQPFSASGSAGSSRRR